MFKSSKTDLKYKRYQDMARTLKPYNLETGHPIYFFSFLMISWKNLHEPKNVEMLCKGKFWFKTFEIWSKKRAENIKYLESYW